jgi:hypothetical protein
MVATALVVAAAVLPNKMSSFRQLYAQDSLFYR